MRRRGTERGTEACGDRRIPKLVSLLPCFHLELSSLCCGNMVFLVEVRREEVMEGRWSRVFNSTELSWAGPAEREGERGWGGWFMERELRSISRRHSGSLSSSLHREGGNTEKRDSGEREQVGEGGGLTGT